MITELDAAGALDPESVGAKAAVIAKARRAGIPVLPGFVVEASASVGHMELGAAALTERGSGGARLSVSATPMPHAPRIEEAGRKLAASLVARSSTRLEAGGAWAGVFTSYVGITPEELPKGIVGCWASAFSPEALRLQQRAGIEPGSVPMAVLVQPEIRPTTGGVAEIRAGEEMWVEAIDGSPAPLLQGWRRGVTARRRAGAGWEGEEAISMLGAATLGEIGSILEQASGLGLNRCEWGVGERLWVLQLRHMSHRKPAIPSIRQPTSSELIPLVRALTAAPGRLGAELVLPWAVAGLPATSSTRRVGGGDLLGMAYELRGRLMGQVWGSSGSRSMEKARAVLDGLRGGDSERSLEVLRGLAPPDPEDAHQLISAIVEIGERLAEQERIPDPRSVWHLSVDDLKRAQQGGRIPPVTRLGTSVWEPLVAAVVLDHGMAAHGVPASPGIGAGVRHHVDTDDNPPHRAVVTADSALPGLSQLVWDAAGLVTDGGGPSAHVFESTRSLGVPAVCGVPLGGGEDQIVAVDGYTGQVSTLPLAPDP